MKAKLAKLLAEKKTLSRPIAGPQLRAGLRRSWRQKQTIKSQSKEIRRLRRAVRTLEAVKAQAAKHRAARETLTKALFDRTTELRVALRRSRRQKNTIRSLSKGIRRLRKIAKASQTRIEKLEAQYARLRASASVLQKALFGSRSEQQEKPRSERKRGQQRGAPGHGRTQRPALEEKAEHHNPPKTARLCSCCGKPYVANGENSSTVIEIEVEAHTRRIVRPRWRRGCDCASSPLEVSAPPVPRLFPRTPYGTSVWACFLYERYACLRPLHRVSAWMSDQGLPISVGTLADSVPRFLPLFEPFDEAILTHQSRTAVRHGDETVWRIQSLKETGRSSRAWLWTSVSDDAVYFHIDPSRTGEGSPQTARDKKIVESGKGRQGGPRGADLHAGAARRIEHPGGYLDVQARLYLNRGHGAVSAMLDPFDAQSSSEMRVPAIMDHAFLADMGRMNARLPWAGKIISSWAQPAAARPPPSPTD